MRGMLLAKRSRCGWWVLVLALVWAGGLDLAQAQAPRRLGIAAPSRSLTWFPLVMAKQRGLFREEGLEVDFLVMNPAIGIKALVAGDVDYSTAFGSSIRAAVTDVPIRVVVLICNKPLFMLVSKPAFKSVPDLKGKVLATSEFGSTTDYNLRAVLSHYGLNPDRDVKIIAVGSGTNRLAALQAGSIDASLLEAPYNILAARQGFTQLLFAGDIVESPISGLSTTTKKIREQPEQIRRVVRATLRGIAHTKGNREEAVRLIAEWNGVERYVAEGSYDLAVKSWKDDGLASDESIGLEIKNVQQRLKLEKEVPVSKVADWSFVRQVWGELRAR